MDRSRSGAVPFVDLIRPLVEEAGSTLRARASDSFLQLSSEAHVKMESSLLHTLGNICGQALELGFSLFRARRETVTQTLPELPCPQVLYRQFVRNATPKGLLGLIEEYRPLQSTVVLCVEQWIRATQEFCERLQADRAEIATFFNRGQDPGVVTDIGTDLSDRHDGGRTVLALEFSSGLQLVYKPKDLGTDEVYFSILDWCNRNGVPLEFRALRVLRKPGYGWEMLVDRRPCDNEGRVRRYYLRAGQLLCLIYVLAGTDCHFDNLIACGEQPILIDTEMLFQPRLPGEFSGNADTVMRTGLLPGAKTLDLSGLGCTTEQPTHLRVPEWQHVNTDRMRLSFRPARLESRNSVVMRGDTPVSALDYVDSIAEGFRHMYRFLMTRRQALLASDGPLASIAGQKVRVLARGTMEYLLALSDAFDPKHLRASDCLRIRFREPSRFSGLEPFEVAALQRMDVPRFFAEASAKVWSPSAEAGISVAFFETGLERVLSGIEQLSEAALERQLGIMKLAWAMSGLSKIS